MNIRVTLGVILVVVISLWFYVNKKHDFNNAIPSPTADEVTIFQNLPDSMITKIYSRHFNNPNFRFPRSEARQIILYKNNWLRKFTSQRLKSSWNDSITNFFNNPNNFDWSETTWQYDEAEYILKFLDSNRNLIGQIYLCLKDCGHLESSPFTPNMKFGRIKDSALNIISRIIKNKAIWL